ncbi:MAG TPA: DUF2254 domain-containing protein [Rubrobacteraceae bacterium]|nr:DUF2254 domain-containing protein [Rubrobacteraceae bacterium]
MSNIANRLTALLYTLRLTLWFLPGLIAVGGVGLFALTYALDLHLQKVSSPTELPIFFSGGADAARSLLSAIVASLITVIATIFSVTIVTLQLASSQYSPRLLQRFMSDRLVQIALGTYAATFVYAVLVLRLIRSPESFSGTFNPLVSVPVALLMALISVALLIYFIHHIADMSQSSSIVQAVHDDALSAITKLETLEEELGTGTGEEKEHRALEKWPEDLPVPLLAQKSGYVRSVDANAIMQALDRRKGTIFVDVPLAPGTYATAGLPTARLWLPDKEPLTSQEEHRLRQAIILGSERIMMQDLTFSLRQLADIALKGLSPGINDPTTTVQALNAMGSMFVALGSKRLPPNLARHEANGCRTLVRIDYPPFDKVVGIAFDQVRRAALTSGQVGVLEELLAVLERALAANRISERQETLWERVYLLARQTAHQIPDTYDAISLCRKAVDVGAPLLHTALRQRVISDLEDLASLYEEIPRGERVREAVEAAAEDLKAEDS